MRPLSARPIVATLVLALSFFPDKGEALRYIFPIAACILLLAVPLALLLPDPARERWLARRAGSAAPTEAVTAPVPVQSGKSV